MNPPAPPLPISTSDQFVAVLNAPLPFFLALLAVSVILWGVIRWAYQWRYDGTIEMLNAMLRLAAEENRIAKDRQAASSDTVKKLTEEMGGLKASGSIDRTLQ